MSLSDFIHRDFVGDEGPLKSLTVADFDCFLKQAMRDQGRKRLFWQRGRGLFWVYGKEVSLHRKFFSFVNKFLAEQGISIQEVFDAFVEETGIEEPEQRYVQACLKDLKIRVKLATPPRED